jgi:hypothetical protein
MSSEKDNLLGFLDDTSNFTNRVKVSVSSGSKSVPHIENIGAIADYTLGCATWLRRTCQSVALDAFLEIPKENAFFNDAITNTRQILRSGTTKVVTTSVLYDATVACHATVTNLHKHLRAYSQIQPPPRLPTGLRQVLVLLGRLPGDDPTDIPDEDSTSSTPPDRISPPSDRPPGDEDIDPPDDDE